MNKNNTASYITTALSIALIVVSAKNLIKSTRRLKKLNEQIHTDTDLDVKATFNARDVMIEKINRGDFLGRSMDEIAAEFAEQIKFEKIAIRY